MKCKECGSEMQVTKDEAFGLGGITGIFFGCGLVCGGIVTVLMLWLLGII